MIENRELTVKLAAALARYTGNQKVIGSRLAGNDDIGTLLDDLEFRFAGGIRKVVVCSDGSGIVDGINVYVNGDNVRYLKGLKTPLQQGDVVNIIPAAAAG